MKPLDFKIMRRTLASIFMLLNTFAVVYAGNNQRAQTNKAHASYEKGKYVEAVTLYSALDNPTLQIQERIAHCHYYLRDYAKASRAQAELSRYPPKTIRFAQAVETNLEQFFHYPAQCGA